MAPPWSYGLGFSNQTATVAPRMKRKAYFLFLLLLGGPFFWFMKERPPAVATPPSQNFLFGVINTKRIKEEARIFQKASQYIEAQHQKIHEEIFKQENEIRTRIEMLKKKKADQEEKKNIDQKIIDVEKMVKEKKEALTEIFDKMSKGLEENLQAAINKIAKARGLHCVLNKFIQETQSVFYLLDASMDITNDVIQELNKKEVFYD